MMLGTSFFGATERDLDVVHIGKIEQRLQVLADLASPSAPLLPYIAQPLCVVVTIRCQDPASECLLQRAPQVGDHLDDISGRRGASGGGGCIFSPTERKYENDQDGNEGAQ